MIMMIIDKIDRALNINLFEYCVELELSFPST